jgi:predicted DNA binding protein
VLVDYADAAGYALSAAMWQWELSSNAATVLKFDITGPVSLTELCVHSDCDALEVTSVVPRSNETVYYLAFPGDRVTLEATVEQCDGIRPYGDGDGVRAVVVEEETVECHLVELGAQIRSFRVTADEMTITLAVPSSRVARAVRGHVREAYADARVTVRWGSGDHAEAVPLSGNVGAVMTDRQYEILIAAYRYGYFERDPAVNLSDLADVLDVSRWTVSEHLRVAQREMLSELLE